METTRSAKMSLFAFDYPQLEEIEAQFNPEELDFSFSPNYDTVDIIGGTNRPVHYTGNDNPTVPINLRFWAVTASEMARLYDARNFLMRAVYPVALTGVTSAPTRILLTSPNIVCVTGFIRKLNIKHLLWAASGKIRNFEAHIEFEILPGQEITAEFIDSAGFMWAAGSENLDADVIEET